MAKKKKKKNVKLFYLSVFYRSVSGAGSNFCRLGTLLDVNERHYRTTQRMLELDIINETKTILKAINELVQEALFVLQIVKGPNNLKIFFFVVLFLIKFL